MHLQTTTGHRYLVNHTMGHDNDDGDGNGNGNDNGKVEPSND